MWLHQIRSLETQDYRGHLSLRLTSRWWFQIFSIFTPNLGEMIQFHEYFSDGLVQPPTRLDLYHTKASLAVIQKSRDDPSHPFKDVSRLPVLRIPKLPPGFFKTKKVPPPKKDAWKPHFLKEGTKINRVFLQLTFRSNI